MRLAIIILSIILVVCGLVMRGYIDSNSDLKDSVISLKADVGLLEEQIGRYKQDEIAYREEITQISDSLSWALRQIDELELKRDFCQEDSIFWKKAYSGKAEGNIGGISYREFASVGELEEWLAQNEISDRKWHPLYDCDNFAIDLTLSALGDGYWIGLGATDNHLFNFTIIGNDVYRIEASQDGVELWGTLD